VIKHHGVYNLEKKHTKLIPNVSNKNDIIKLLGPPSTIGTFDNDVWIFIERSTSSSRLSKLGKKKLLTNNVLVVEINSKGLMDNKVFLNKEKMNNLEFDNTTTVMNKTKRSFVYDFLGSLRQKINDPLGKKRNKQD
jgi:outer membrane protein assembly factor BamE (lipoprotein component of BamABCDE complex)